MKSASIWTWVAMGGIVVFVVYLVISLANPAQTTEDLRLDQFVLALRETRVESIEARGGDLRVHLRDDVRTYKVRISADTSVEELLRAESVDLASIDLTVKSESGLNWLGVVLSFLPLVLIVGLVLFMMRSRGDPGRIGAQITRSGARLAPTRPDVTFKDVAGADEAKEELAEVVEFLRHPERYRVLGARVPKGILLMGPPGTGKTYMAKAVAGEANVPFFSISGSQFVELYVGVGAARVRDLFREAKAHAPCLVFIDELDAVGRQRGTGLGGGHDEREQTLNQILVELDGFEPDVGVIVLAATNRPDILDPALIRPGRFDRQVVMDRPDIRGRHEILLVHARGKRFDADVDLVRMAKQTVGMVGADLANLLNEAALLAARRGEPAITNADLDEAVDRVMAGPQRKSRILTLDEKRRIAVHEAGHGLVSHRLPLADPVTKISIVPRGMAGGYTRFAPERDATLRTREELRQRLAAFLAGRAAELLFLGDVSTGAEDDIERATQMARQMVTRWGMSEDLGPMTLGRRAGEVFLGRELAEQRTYSEHLAEEIDHEISRLVSEADAAAEQILTTRRADHQRLVELLLEEETLTGDLLIEALGGPREETALGHFRPEAAGLPPPAAPAMPPPPHRSPN